ncbi:MAG: hypothetical protein ACJAX5_003534 [Patiriisocius sp.]|jgi:hypothetical protein
MNELELLQNWLLDLETVVAQQSLGSDPDIRNQLSEIAIEISGLSVQLPGQSDTLRRAIFKLHMHRVVDQIMEVLQSALGYYNLPDQPHGNNEPIIGPALAHRLKNQLISKQVDVYEIKDQLTLLIKDQKGQVK